MTLQEAIKNLTFLSREGTQDMEFGDYEAVRLGVEALEFRETIFTRIEASLQWLVNDDGTWNWAKWVELKLGCRLPSETV